MKELPKLFGIWMIHLLIRLLFRFISYQEKRKQVTVALSGEGADELFGGYNIYNEPNSLAMFNKMPGVFKSMLNNLARIMPEGMRGKSFLERGTTPMEERYIGNAKMFTEKKNKFYFQNINLVMTIRILQIHFMQKQRIIIL